MPSTDLANRIRTLTQRGLSRYGRGDLEGALGDWEHAISLDAEQAEAAVSYLQYVRQNFDALDGQFQQARAMQEQLEAVGLPVPNDSDDVSDAYDAIEFVNAPDTEAASPHLDTGWELDDFAAESAAMADESISEARHETTADSPTAVRNPEAVLQAAEESAEREFAHSADTVASGKANIWDTENEADAVVSLDMNAPTRVPIEETTAIRPSKANASLATDFGAEQSTASAEEAETLARGAPNETSSESMPAFTLQIDEELNAANLSAESAGFFATGGQPKSDEGEAFPEASSESGAGEDELDFGEIDRESSEAAHSIESHASSQSGLDLSAELAETNQRGFAEDDNALELTFGETSAPNSAGADESVVEASHRAETDGPSDWLDMARGALEQGDLDAAYEAAEGLCDHDSAVMEEHEDLFSRIYEGVLGGVLKVPSLVVGDADISQLALDPKASFLLSRLDGMMCIEEVFDICGMPRLEATRIFAQLLKRNLIDLQ